MITDPDRNFKIVTIILLVANLVFAMTALSFAIRSYNYNSVNFKESTKTEKGKNSEKKNSAEAEETSSSNPAIAELSYRKGEIKGVNNLYLQGGDTNTLYKNLVDLSKEEPFFNAELKDFKLVLPDKKADEIPLICQDLENQLDKKISELEKKDQ